MEFRKANTHIIQGEHNVNATVIPTFPFTVSDALIAAGLSSMFGSSIMFVELVGTYAVGLGIATGMIGWCLKNAGNGMDGTSRSQFYLKAHVYSASILTACTTILLCRILVTSGVINLGMI